MISNRKRVFSRGRRIVGAKPSKSSQDFGNFPGWRQMNGPPLRMAACFSKGFSRRRLFSGRSFSGGGGGWLGGLLDGGLGGRDGRSSNDLIVVYLVLIGDRSRLGSGLDCCNEVLFLIIGDNVGLSSGDRSLLGDDGNALVLIVINGATAVDALGHVVHAGLEELPGGTESLVGDPDTSALKNGSDLGSATEHVNGSKTFNECLVLVVELGIKCTVALLEGDGVGGRIRLGVTILILGNLDAGSVAVHDRLVAHARLLPPGTRVLLGVTDDKLINGLNGVVVCLHGRIGILITERQLDLELLITLVIACIHGNGHARSLDAKTLAIIVDISLAGTIIEFFSDGDRELGDIEISGLDGHFRNGKGLYEWLYMLCPEAG
jgi:hypothetical protein